MVRICLQSAIFVQNLQLRKSLLSFIKIHILKQTTPRRIDLEM